MWPNRQHVAERLYHALEAYSVNRRSLPGCATHERRSCLSWQMVASLRRLDYTNCLLRRPTDRRRADPASKMFDPERAAIFHLKNGNIDEAFWLTFLSIHFGKHKEYGWRRLRDVYSGLGEKTWSWQEYTADPDGFDRWLTENYHRIGGAFGNHRKYASLRPNSDQGTDKVFRSYMEWVGPERSHHQLVQRLVRAGGNDPTSIFHKFYQDMKVKQFGRLGKFDFLALVGRLGLAPIKPGSTYMEGATGPLRGARLLFANDPKGSIPVRDLEAWLVELDEELQIGMQAMEDSLCNWQKSPDRFVHFKG